jgi:Type II secretion system (T2SS), protein E, N-terminal domain
MSLAIGHEPRTPSGFESLPGVTPPSSREPQPGFLTDTIVAMELVDQAHAEAAVAESRVRGIPAETLLVDQGHLSDENLARARAERAGLDYVDLETFERDHDADAVIGRDAALRYHALPISVQGRALVVALADPFDAPAIGEIAALAKRDVIPVVASATAIDARAGDLPKLEDVAAEVAQLQPIEGGGGGGRRATDAPGNRRATDAPRNRLPDSLSDRIVEKVDAALGEVARSEILKALDDATTEIEELSAKLEQAEQRASALESERDELRAALGSDPASS